MTLVFKDPEGRISTALVDSASWIDVWQDGEQPPLRMEYHRPVKETGVGNVDKPVVVRTDDIESGVNALLAGMTGVDRGELTGRLEARVRPQG